MRIWESARAAEDAFTREVEMFESTADFRSAFVRPREASLCFQ